MNIYTHIHMIWHPRYFLYQVNSSALKTKSTYRSIEDVMKMFIVTENEIVDSTIPLMIAFIEKGVRIH